MGDACHERKALSPAQQEDETVMDVDQDENIKKEDNPSVRADAVDVEVVVKADVVTTSIVAEEKKNDFDETDDDMEALFLRYRFADHSFYSCWRALQDCGWKHGVSTGAYHAPGEDEKEFRSANDVLNYLDQGCLPDITSNLQNLERADTLEYDDDAYRTAWNHRLEVVRRLTFLATKRRESSFFAVKSHNEKAERKNAENILTDDVRNRKDKTSSVCKDGIQDGEGENSNARQSTQCKAQETNKVENKSVARDDSATMTEKGTKLYLHKNSTKHFSKKKAKAAVNAAASAAAINPSCLDFDSLVRPTLEECAFFIENYCNKSYAVLQQHDHYKAQYPDWRFLLSTNHSLLFYGSGSKYDLLTDFANEELEKEGYVLLIDGFDPNVSISGILSLLVDLFLNGSEPSDWRSLLQEQEYPIDPDALSVVGRSIRAFDSSAILCPKEHGVIERAICISRAIAQRWAANTLIPIFLVIHNIEGQGLRNSAAQDALAHLVANSCVANNVASIRLVASVDHVETSAILWSVSTGANFSWIYKQVHTHTPYTKELIMQQDQEVHKTKTATRHARQVVKAQRVIEILNTIAPRHKEVVQILAGLQLQKITPDKPNEWINYAVLRSECKARCVISKHAQLNDFLGELEDHGIVAFQKVDGVEFVRIPVDTSKLKEILSCDKAEQK